MSNHSDSSLQDPATRDNAACLTQGVDAARVERVRSRLADDGRVALTTAIFSAVADPTRFRILDALCAEELCVCDIAELCGVSQSGVSHQLKLLRDRGLVTYRREGNRAVYRLADEHVRSLLTQGLAHADERAEDR
jgi:ArsR family transcriptional regulator, lead/cadmium/zinc/bismuth-responsive transcriptional repressor